MVLWAQERNEGAVELQAATIHPSPAHRSLRDTGKSLLHGFDFAAVTRGQLLRVITSHRKARATKTCKVQWRR